jgi:2-polyprenyl-3-methyl-5-hydroxy-6-metoxy-1,4-benzoquinol methylase
MSQPRPGAPRGFDGQETIQTPADAELVGCRQQGESLLLSPPRDALTGRLINAHAQHARADLTRLMVADGPVEVDHGYVSSIVDLTYGGINDTYLGVDSHLPSHFRRLYPCLLDRLVDDKDDTLVVNDCYRRQMVRVLPQDLSVLQDDLHTSANRSVVESYFAWHERNGVLLLRVDPVVAADAHADHDLWTTDLGLWIRTCAILFQSEIEDEDSVRLQMLAPDAYEQFELCPRYAKLLLEHAIRIRYDRGRGIYEEPLQRQDREHLSWSLEQIFEPELAQAWRDFVNPSQRLRRGEEDFLTGVLDTYRGDREPPAVRVFDASAGVGVESVALQQKGYDVTSNEIDWTLMRQARAYAAEQGVGTMPMTSYDWRHLETEIEPATYDVVLCLGNALACLLDPEEMKKCLRGFRSILKDGGMLILDERNYRDMISRREEMLGSEFRFNGNVVYCSDDISAKPQSISAKGESKQRVILAYFRNGERLGTFTVYPYADGEVEALLSECGFAVETTVYDFGKSADVAHEFVTYAARALPTDSAG